MSSASVEEMMLRKFAFTAFKIAYRIAYRLLGRTGIIRLPLVLWIEKKLVSTLGDDCLVVEGRKLCFDPYDLNAVRVRLSIYGTYEPGTTNLFNKIVKQGMTVVDIGAHVGYYTLLAAQLVGSNGRVYAFEPDPSNMRLLVRNIKANGLENVIPIQRGVADYVGTATLFVNTHDAAYNSIYYPGVTDGYRALTIDATTLDDFFGDTQEAVDLIKIDIEGAEMAAVAGMPKTLVDNPRLMLIIEFSPSDLVLAGASPADFLNRLSEYGFRLHLIDETTGCLEQMDAAQIMSIYESSKRRGRNLFCERH